MLRKDDGRVTTAGRMLDLLRTRGTLSRVELAELSGLTQARITHVVRRLLDGGLVREVGREQQGRGQPRRLLELEADAWYAVGVQFDRTTTTIVVIDFAGRRVATAGFRGTGTSGPDSAVSTLADQVDDLVHRTGVPRGRVLGVGLVTHGPQDRERGMLLMAHPTPDWLQYPLTSTLSNRLGLPVLLENDATAAATGEQWSGTVPTDTFGLIYLGSGLGGGIVADGNAYRGRASNAVEIGHVGLMGASAPCVCGNRGCAEAEAGPRTVVAQVLARPDLAERLGIKAHEENTLADFGRVVRGWQAGDPDATTILQQSARWIGRTAVTMVNLFDLDTVVLAGPALISAGPLYQQFIEAELTRHALSRKLSRPRVLLSANVDTAAAIGGALHVLRSVAVEHIARTPA
ncbi:Sugar kinase of the NBD/HSP70 family, may contain an N-terminal HTH domain [Micromonospora matsumotoense]|uniref:Sugar kinase of the NBD/HSP70 family, may contain an N-terminal HTH domain n=1 Tax=Micromonospora matsumotoense TaxID=121616 RepID=A0A1C5AUY1_9ACTN|nr:ROK family transcriptional regulator [Micromonospora matsumotoense]SCF48834.1 Sugar kinase of the NBD/HSP70 family, may contain an N-terminal HTH domain [Micromonospora matsumotoense]